MHQEILELAMEKQAEEIKALQLCVQHLIEQVAELQENELKRKDKAQIILKTLTEMKNKTKEVKESEVKGVKNE